MSTLHIRFESNNTHDKKVQNNQSMTTCIYTHVSVLSPPVFKLPNKEKNNKKTCPFSAIEKNSKDHDFTRVVVEIPGLHMKKHRKPSFKSKNEHKMVNGTKKASLFMG